MKKKNKKIKKNLKKKNCSVTLNQFESFNNKKII